MSDIGLITAGEAARKLGVSITAVSNAIRRGRLPVVSRTRRGYLLDPAVVSDVFRNVIRRRAAAGMAPGGLPPPPVRIDARLVEAERARLEARIEQLSAVAALERARAERAERDRDAWRAMAERLSARLPARP